MCFKINYYLTILIFQFLFAISLQAQDTPAFKYLIGGQGEFEYINANKVDIRYLSLSIAPQFGYFITKSIVGGASINYSYLKGDDVESSNFGTKFFSRYYVHSVNIFAEANYGIDFMPVNHSIGLGLGYIIYLTNNLTIEPMLNYNIDKYIHKVNFSIGVQGYIIR